MIDKIQVIVALDYTINIIANIFYYSDHIRNGISKIPKYGPKYIQDEERDDNKICLTPPTKSPSDAKLNLISSILPKTTELNPSKVEF